MLKIITISFVIFSISVGILGADELTIDKKLRKLADLQNLRQTVQKQKTECENGMNDFDPNVVVKTQPNFFGGIMPGSKKWHRVEVAFKKYMSSYCNCLNEKDVVEEYISIYRTRISEETLDSVLSFYDSPSGRKYLEVSNAGTMKLQEYYNEVYTERMKIAVKDYYDEIQDIYDSK